MTGFGTTIFKSQYFKTSMGLIIAFTLLYLSVRNLSWNEVKEEIELINYTWIALALCLYWVELGCRVLRWRILLTQLKSSIDLRHITIAFISGYAANNVLPAKLGEAVRADLLGRLASISRLSVFGSIILERLFDMLVVMAMAAWGVFFATTERIDMLEQVNRSLSLFAALIAMAGLAVYLMVTKKVHLLYQRFKRLSLKVQNLINGLRAVENPSNYLKLSASTVLIWTLNCLAIWSIMMALEVQLSVNQTILLVGITGVAAAIPAAPAGIGTLQYAFYIAAIIFEFPQSAALVASTMVQLVLLGSATLVGATAYSYAISNQLLSGHEARDD